MSDAPKDFPTAQRNANDRHSERHVYLTVAFLFAYIAYYLPDTFSHIVSLYTDAACREKTDIHIDLDTLKVTHVLKPSCEQQAGQPNRGKIMPAAYQKTADSGAPAPP